MVTMVSRGEVEVVRWILTTLGQSRSLSYTFFVKNPSNRPNNISDYLAFLTNWKLLTLVLIIILIFRGESRIVEEEDENVKEEAAREGGIVTPETPVSIPALEKKNNMLVNAINNLMEKFLPLETKKFDLQDFSERLRWGLLVTCYNIGYMELAIS